METVDQAITSGEADEVTTNRNVRSSHYPQRPAEAEDIIVGVTKINKYFGSSGWFEGRITKYNEKEKLYDVVYDDGDEESLSLEEVLPQVVLNFLDYYALPVDDSRVGNDSDSEQNSDEEENSVTSSDNSNSEEEEEKTEKFVRRGYLKWRVPRDKYINTKGTENKIMKEACTLGAGSTIPPDVDGFGRSVLARCPKESIRLLVEMALSNKSVAGCVHAIGRVQIAEEWVDVLGVGLLVDAFPRTNDVSGVMWQLTPQFLPEFCNHPWWIVRLFGMDGSESSTLCQNSKYFCEYLCPFFVKCVEKPHEHVFEASIGYHSYGGWPPIEKDRGTFQKKRFCIQPTISSDGAGVAKTFGHSGGSCDYPSAVVVGLKLSEINNPDIMLFDKAQYGSDGDSVKEIKIFWKKIVSKGVPLQDFEYNAPTKFFVDSAQIKAMDEGLKAFVDKELRKPIYEGLSYGDLHNEANPERKKLAAKLRKIIREKHSYRAGHGFVRPGIGGLLVWLRSCRLHAEQNFVKLLAGHMVLLCAKWDAAEGALETIAAGLANSRCEAMLKEFGAPFQLRRVCKRLLQTLEENGRSTTFGLFTWRFKSQPAGSASLPEHFSKYLG